MTVLVFVMFLGFLQTTSASGSWGYGETHYQVYGPKDWGHVSSFCNGHSQSPVNIVREDVEDDDDNNYDLGVVYQNQCGLMKGTLVNNGHSPTFSVDTSQGGASLLDPVYGETYILAQFHFHFGCTDNVGSEHTIDGKSFPGELHLVFYNSKYGNIGNAATKPDGLVVIGAFMRKGYPGIQELVTFSRHMTSITKEGTEKTGIYVKLDHLVPGLSSGDRSYYTYKGSLTTPGCYESVRWIVLKDPINADQEVLNNFRVLQAAHGFSNGKMCNNYRPTQSLNGREIYLYE